MLRVTVRLHGDLGRFAGRRDVVVRALPAPTTTEDLVESVGVPHPEVERLLVNGEPSPFGRLVADGDEVAVVPHAPGAAEGLAVPLRPPLGEPRFVLDGHLGRLAGYLRMLGFDTLYEADADDEALAATSAGEERALLTRDIGLLKRSAVVYGRFLRSDNPERQLAEVVRLLRPGP